MITLYESILTGEKEISHDVNNGLAEKMAEWLSEQPNKGASLNSTVVGYTGNNIEVNNDKISCEELSFESIKEFPKWIRFRNVELLSAIPFQSHRSEFPKIERLGTLRIIDKDISELKDACKSIDKINRIDINWTFNKKLQFPSHHMDSVIVINVNVINKKTFINDIDNLNANGLVFPAGSLWDFGIEYPKKINSKPKFKDINLFKSIMDEFFTHNDVENVIITTHTMINNIHVVPCGYYVSKNKQGEYTLALISINSSINMINAGRKI